MGIKFNCPNGHKLNVKAFLAGKKGVCPHCGATFRIPNQPADDDDEEPAALTGGPGAGSFPANPMPGSVPVGAAVSAPVAIPTLPIPSAMPAALPTGSPVQPHAGNAPAAVPVGVAPVGVPAPMAVPTPHPSAYPSAVPVAGMPVRPAMPGVMPGVMPMPGAMPVAAPPAAAGLYSDPIAEAPAAQWYVRPPTGAQYGPARGDIMRKWIAEGRVSADSLVWREGWADWKNAGQLFPNLNAAGAASGGGIGPLGDLGTASRSTRTAGRYATRQKSNTGLALAALIFLGIICVVLVGVLVYVVINVQ